MCDNCFPTEIKLFKDKADWILFDHDLQKKREQGQIKYIKLTPDSFRDKDDVEYIYECVTCGQKWRLREPWNVNDGYCLKLSTEEKVTTPLTLNQKLILGLLISIFIVIINVIYWLWTN